jgi:hypothetical protein
MKISSIRRDLCAILGVDESGFHATLVSIDEPLVGELLAEISDISLCIREIMKEHAALFEKMKELLESIKSGTTQSIRHLRHVKKKPRRILKHPRGLPFFSAAACPFACSPSSS